MIIYLTDGGALVGRLQGSGGPCVDVARARDVLAARELHNEEVFVFPDILAETSGALRLHPEQIRGFRAQTEGEVGRRGGEALDIWLRDVPAPHDVDSTGSPVGLGDRDPARRGDWGQTAGGRRFYPLDPRPEEIELEDVAHGLSHLCRFNGHTSTFYSVAQHSLHVLALTYDRLRDVDMHRSIRRDTLLWALLHDAPEAYIGDMIRPLKIQPELAAFRRIDHAIMAAVCRRFELAPNMPEVVRAADDIAVVTEARDLMWNPQWGRNKNAAPDRRRLTGGDNFPRVAALFVDAYARIHAGELNAEWFHGLWPEVVGA